MRDENLVESFAAEDELIEPPGVLEIYVDDFVKHIRQNGNMSCVGVRDYAEGRTVVVRLVWPARNTDTAIEDAREAMAAPEVVVAPKDRKRGSRKRVH